MGWATRVPRGARARIADRAGTSVGNLHLIMQGNRTPSFGLAVRLVTSLHDELGLSLSLEEIMNIPMPIPVNVRLRECDPVLTDRQLAELERRQYALLGYCAEDHEPPPAPPDDDDRQLDLVEYARRAAG